MGRINTIISYLSGRNFRETCERAVEKRNSKIIKELNDFSETIKNNKENISADLYYKLRNSFIRKIIDVQKEYGIDTSQIKYHHLYEDQNEKEIVQ